MAIPVGKWSCAAGELAPGLWGHIDFQKYPLGLATCRNAFIHYHGGAYSRAGTHFIGYSRQTTNGSLPPRLITFQFSSIQGLCLEFGNFYMRVISNGGLVLESAMEISGITQASPAVVTSAAHGFSNGDWVYLSGISGPTELNGLIYVVHGVTTNAFQIYDVFGTPITTALSPAYAGGGTAARVFTLATPWAEADLKWLKFTQSADVMSIFCWNQDTNVGPGGDISYAEYQLERITDDNWTLNAFSAASSVSPPATVTLTASNTNTGSTAPATQYQVVVTTVDQLTGEESQASEIATVSGSVDIAAISGSLTTLWSTVNGQNYYNVYMAPAAVLTTVPPGSLFGYVQSSFGTQAVDTNITPDFNQVPPLHIDPFQPGQILYVPVTNGSSGLSSVTYSITTSTGSGFSGYPVIVSGVLVAFVVTNNGKLYKPGDSIVLNGIGFATGAIVFTANPSNGDTITLNGVVWTFVTSGATGAETNIKASLDLTLLQLATDLTASVNPSLTVASYIAEPVFTSTNLTITYNTAGASGDAYTLAASAATPSGPTLVGGTGSGVLAATLEIGPQTGTHPSVGAYFQQRFFQAGTPNQPDTYFGSQPGAFSNYDTRIPTIDSDAITGDPWSVQVNGIQWMIPMPGGLVVFTGLQAWQLGGAGSSPLQPQAITPANQQAEAQAFNGCNPYMPPIRKDYDIVYLQYLGSIFRDLSYNIYAGIYTGNDITYLSSHLFSGLQMRESAWCEEPFKIIWVTREDGILLSFTFFKEQEVLAWTRHDTQGLTWSVTSVTEPPVNALYLATQRVINGQNSFMIERQDNRTWNGVETTWCVDAGLSLAQPAPAAAITIVGLDGLGSIIGTENFQGGNNYSNGTVAAYIDGPTNAGPGRGAAASVAVIGGVLQPPFITAPGKGYLNPILIFTDPAGSGTLAAGTPVIGNSAMVTASAPVFMPNPVGQIIRGASGIATITGFTSPTAITVNVTQPFQTAQAGAGFLVLQAGAWTMTEPVSLVRVPHLAGAVVTGLADGQVIPPIRVGQDGTFGLGVPASSITVGLPFTVQMQTLRPETGQPTTQGQRKKIGSVSVRVKQSLGFSVGVNQPDGSAQSPMQLDPLWTGMTPVPPPGRPIGQPPYQSNVTPLFTDDVQVPQASGWNKHGQVALQQTLPLPLQLLAVVTQFLEGDVPEQGVTARPPGTIATSKGFTI